MQAVIAVLGSHYSHFVHSHCPPICIFAVYTLCEAAQEHSTLAVFAAPEQLKLQAISKISGHVKLPGSKSLSNRILLLAALARGTTRIENLLVSAGLNLSWLACI